MSKRVLVLAAMLALAGCSPTVVTPFVTPAHYYSLDGEKVEIGGIEYRHQNFMTNNIPTNEVVVTFNGYKVLDGYLHEGETRELNGHFRKHAVRGMCVAQERSENWVSITCDIFIDGREALKVAY